MKFINIKIIETDGKKYFCGKDVCDILNYSNYNDALKKNVDKKNMEILWKLTDEEIDYKDIQKKYINEKGLSQLLEKSMKEEATNLKIWFENLNKKNKLECNETKNLNNLKTIEINKKKYFDGKEICDILNYENYIDTLNTYVDEKDKINVEILSQKNIYVNENGLNVLIINWEKKKLITDKEIQEIFDKAKKIKISEYMDKNVLYLFYHTINNDHLIKMGFTHNIKLRECQLRKTLNNLKLIGIKECNSFRDENNLKFELKQKCNHYKNEMFYLDKMLYDVFNNFKIEKTKREYDDKIKNEIEKTKQMILSSSGFTSEQKMELLKSM